jgi:hypothetical protein
MDCFAASAVDGLPIWDWRRFADVSARGLCSHVISKYTKRGIRRLESKSLHSPEFIYWSIFGSSFLQLDTEYQPMSLQLLF